MLNETDPLRTITTAADELSPQAGGQQDTDDKLKPTLEARLLLASLRTEAVRAGMIDLDGLKLIDTSKIQLGEDDRIVDGHAVMEDLRRSKPWLFKTASSSSVSPTPFKQPLRQKMAMEMTDDEYAAARSAITNRRH